MNEKRPAPQQIRLFESDRLERLTTISPWAFCSLWVVVLSLAAYAGWGTAEPAAEVAWVLGGLVFWTLFEYAMHRFMFHWNVESNWARSVVFVLHGNHHAEPGNRARNLMPPIISIPISGAVLCLLLLAVGSVGFLFFLGFMFGYAVYDGLHFACHQFTMRGRVLWRWQQHHLHHHYAKEEGNYAITAIFWDRVFGTKVASRNN
jgi:sterol desaturase/sphingolipid hydroxylase (fatty acid hydroxylase superfamily)